MVSNLSIHKYISFNSLIGEIGIVWDNNNDILEQVLLPELTTRKQNPARIRFNGVITETNPNEFVYQTMSDIKDIILGKNIKYDINKLDFSDLTEFQQKVLKKQAEIPYGKVISYKKLAELIGKPRSARPVANVLSNNYYPLVIPCHRTVRSDWTLGGYDGSLNNYYKKFLLENEEIKIYNGIITEEYRFPQLEK